MMADFGDNAINRIVAFWGAGLASRTQGSSGITPLNWNNAFKLE
jgi:hypothetical protein